MMAKSAYRVVAIPAQDWAEFEGILARNGYKLTGGYGSKRGHAVMELLRYADAVRKVTHLNDAEYRAATAESDARLNANPPICNRFNFPEASPDGDK